MNVAVKTKVEFFEFNVEPLSVESAVFDDYGFYQGVGTAADIYRININGGTNSKGVTVPARNPLPFVENYLQSSLNRYADIWASETPERAGYIIGEDLNNFHKLAIERFASPVNADATIFRKGFNDPLFETGRLLSSVVFSINGEGRYF